MIKIIRSKLVILSSSNVIIVLILLLCIVAANDVLAKQCTFGDYYLLRPDVKAAKMDPYIHYISYGKDEGMCKPVRPKKKNFILPPIEYADKSFYSIKGIHPDHYGPEELTGGQIGNISVNLLWTKWQPVLKNKCDIKYLGHCFKKDKVADMLINRWNKVGTKTTGIIYGVPEWARKNNKSCSPAQKGFEIFCSPDNPQDFARFAGMLAKQYKGKITNFVIFNEVNTNVWYDIGCGEKPSDCDYKKWVKSYSDNYNAAYDSIIKENPNAKVLISIDHHFDLGPGVINTDVGQVLSAKELIKEIDKKAGNRNWNVAIHPYPPNIRCSNFSVDDLNKYKKITFGSIGLVVGWLHKEFPTKFEKLDVQITEAGVNSANLCSSEKAQAKAICDSFRNVLGTPGITNFIYHRLKDNTQEGGLLLGLIRMDDKRKPSWKTWTSLNQLGSYNCGFEFLPYTRLQRAQAPNKKFYASTRLLPKNYVVNHKYFLLRKKPLRVKSTLLYECKIGNDNFVSKSCEKGTPYGPLGYAYQKKKKGRITLYSCYNSKLKDHMISHTNNCEGLKDYVVIENGILGYLDDVKK